MSDLARCQRALFAIFPSLLKATVLASLFVSLLCANSLVVSFSISKSVLPINSTFVHPFKLLSTGRAAMLSYGGKGLTSRSRSRGRSRSRSTLVGVGAQ